VTAQRARLAVIALLAALAAGVLAWQRDSLASGSFLALLWIAPLLVPLPGLLRGTRYTYAWSTLLMTGYVALGLTEVIANPGSRAAAAAIVLVAFAAFVAMVVYLRLSRDRESGG
jgi:uncharacterized membrane protein